MITAFLLNLLLCSLGEDKEAPSAAVDGGTPVIVVHLDGRRFAGFISDLEADPLSVLLLDSTTSTVLKRMVDTLRVLKGAMSEPKPCVVVLKDGSQRRGMLLEDGFEGVRLQVGPRTGAGCIELSKVAGVRWRPHRGSRNWLLKSHYSLERSGRDGSVHPLADHGRPHRAGRRRTPYAENFPEASATTKQLQALLAARPQVDEQPQAFLEAETSRLAKRCVDANRSQPHSDLGI